jgi:hypothetical protein
VVSGAEGGQQIGFETFGHLIEYVGLQPSLDREQRGDCVLWVDSVALGRVAVPLFDAQLGVLAVAAHVPLADGTVRTPDRIGPARPLAGGASTTRPSDSWPCVSRASPGGTQP